MSKPTFDQDLNQLESQIAALRNDFTHIMSTLGDLSQTSAATLRAALMAKADALRDGGANGLSDLSQTAEAKLNELTDHARRNPVQAFAIVGGIGLLLGLIFGRR
ncbi:MAG: hypothetical protein JWS10_3750 [Cypionkella sp.]|uniref:hypothetical protein n=1 Tax=Cypionkella sp. TaxID=2811411 RepID=UPI0026218227|nr:hypothetical protein [Cypionkella sp.]MDB5661135.1 hypothetical protein [Cypionkella sp.]MDB5666352.1 hypothetical protein [Cypionkella sp.]